MADEYKKVDLYITLVVFNLDATQDKIVDWVEAEKGYFTVRSPASLVVRFPAVETEAFKTLMESLQEEVKDIRQDTTDLRESILSVRSGIKSREEVLNRELKLINQADVEGTLDIENEVTALLEEIEELKGRLLKMENDLKYTYAEISFSFKRSALPSNVPSSFDWINTMGLYKMMGRGESK
ncbi:MAG: DUF4349 domain-containing protein [Spirochaetales bacterium]|nr:DUF4349 domain-containing protein [Spirochaetales bacterium]